MTRRLHRRAAAVLLAVAGTAHAEGVDRKTCVVAMAAYPKIHEALVASQSKEAVAAIIVAEGHRAGVERALLEQNAARWVDLMRGVPQELLPSPDWVREQRDFLCARYPK